MRVGLQAQISAPVRMAARDGRSLPQRAWVALSGVMAAILGVLPHVLHHAGPLAGAALLGGVGGSLLFGVLGFLAAAPFLVRLRRRYGNWRAPGAALALFAVVFSISTFAVGPAIGGGDGSSSKQTRPAPAAPAPESHQQHHQ